MLRWTSSHQANSLRWQQAGSECHYGHCDHTRGKIREQGNTNTSMDTTHILRIYEAWTWIQDTGPCSCFLHYTLWHVKNVNIMILAAWYYMRAIAQAKKVGIFGLDATCFTANWCQLSGVCSDTSSSRFVSWPPLPGCIDGPVSYIFHRNNAGVPLRSMASRGL